MKRKHNNEVVMLNYNKEYDNQRRKTYNNKIEE